jgi:hypothetical protein
MNRVAIYPQRPAATGLVDPTKCSDRIRAFQGLPLSFASELTKFTVLLNRVGALSILSIVFALTPDPST